MPAKSHSRLWFFGAALLLPALTGCFAPLHSYAVPATQLPDTFRMPTRIVGNKLNLANLVVPPPSDYLLGLNDVLEISIPGMIPGVESPPMKVRVMANGEIQLPLVGAVSVKDMNLLQAQQAITQAYADGFLQNPRVSVSLAEKSTFDVVVLGEVKQPGIQTLPKYQNDVGHALASANGLTELAGDVIEVHRRVGEIERIPMRPDEFDEYDLDAGDPKKILRIPLRGVPGQAYNQNDVTLVPGDVVVVPSRLRRGVLGRGTAQQDQRHTLPGRRSGSGTGRRSGAPARNGNRRRHRSRHGRLPRSHRFADHRHRPSAKARRQPVPDSCRPDRRPVQSPRHRVGAGGRHHLPQPGPRVVVPSDV